MVIATCNLDRGCAVHGSTPGRFRRRRLHLLRRGTLARHEAVPRSSQRASHGQLPHPSRRGCGGSMRSTVRSTKHACCRTHKLIAAASSSCTLHPTHPTSTPSRQAFPLSKRTAGAMGMHSALHLTAMMQSRPFRTSTKCLIMYLRSRTFVTGSRKLVTSDLTLIYICFRRERTVVQVSDSERAREPSRGGKAAKTAREGGLARYIHCEVEK